MPGTTPILHLPYPLQSEAPDGPAGIKALADALDGSTAGTQGVFIIGEVRFIAVAAPPGGWLLADGRAISRTTYAALFTALAVTYGPGDGTTTFNVPDLRGRVPVGASAAVGGGVETSPPTRAAGSKWGVNAVILSAAQMPVHSHTLSITPFVSRQYSGNPAVVDQNGFVSASNGYSGLAPTQIYGSSYGTAGSGGSHENAPPSIAIPAYIYAGA